MYLIFLESGEKVNNYSVIQFAISGYVILIPYYGKAKPFFQLTLDFIIASFVGSDPFYPPAGSVQPPEG
jgi:hypothetical protein